MKSINRWIQSHKISILLSFVIIILNARDINAQWMDISSARNDIDFAGNIGFIVGNNGTILKSTDSGKNWVNTPNILEEHFDAEYVKLSADGQNIKVLANRYFDGLASKWCNIIESKDGGQTWQRIFDRGGLGKGFFLNDSVGWIQNFYDGGDWRILKTTDGGANWKEDKTFPYVIDIKFYDESHGWALVNYSSNNYDYAVDYAIAKTQDGGNTWQRSFSLGVSTSFTGILSVVDENNALYVTHSGGMDRLSKTSDGGMTWSPICLKKNPNDNGCVDGNSLTSIQMIDSERGWIYDKLDRVLFETADGWNTSSQVPVKDATKVWMKGNNGFLIGLSGLIANTNDNGLTWDTKNHWGFESFFQTLPINDILIRDSSTWAVGDHQVLQSDSSVKLWDNKVEKWPDFSFNSSCNASGIAFFNEQGCIVGPGLIGIRLTNDNGKTWSLVDKYWNGAESPLPSFDWFTFEDLKVYMPAKNTIWLGGENGFVLNSTDFGKTFKLSKQWSAFSGRVRLAFLKNNRVLAYHTDVSFKAEISDDNGASWKVTEEEVASIHFLNEDVGWKLLWNNDLYKTSDGGVTWELIRNMYFTPYLSTPQHVTMFFVDEKAGWLLQSYYNKLYFTKDEGKTWVVENTGVSYNTDQIKFHTYSNGEILGLSAGEGVLRYVGDYKPYKKENQTITFDPISSRKYNDPKFELNARSSSGLPIDYASNDPSVATISKNIVTITGVGITNLSATQKGNIDYSPAKEFQQLQVNKADQVISFKPISDKAIDSEKFNLTASASSGLMVRFEAISDKISVSNSQVTLMKAGRTSITAIQDGNNNYNPAPSVSQSFCINPKKPLITILESSKDSVTLLSNYSFGNQWLFNGEEIPEAINSVFVATTNGAYSLIIREDDCLSESSAIVSLIVTDVTKANQKVEVFPNPILSGYLTIKLGDNQDKKNVFIYHIDGKVIGHREVFGDSSQFDVTGYASGLYLIKVITSNSVEVVKLLKL